MEKKRSLYRGKRNLDYEVPFADKKESMKRIKEHMRKNSKSAESVEEVIARSEQ